jgi:hypothetical protein
MLGARRISWWLWSLVGLGGLVRGLDGTDSLMDGGEFVGKFGGAWLLTRIIDSAQSGVSFSVAVYLICRLTVTSTFQTTTLIQASWAPSRPHC